MKNLSILAVAALIALTASATAGRRQPWPVTVDTTNKVAYGSLADARASADAYQQIGCTVFYDATNRRNQVTCVAANAANVSATCASQDPNLVQIGAAVNGDSFVSFRWDATNACTTIQVTNSSIFGPKAP